MLAHELRNPMAPLKNMLEVMRMPEVPEADMAKAREVMERQVIHLTR